MVWGISDPLESSCPGDPPRPQYLQLLVWNSGPLTGLLVEQSQFSGLGPGDAVPGGPAGAVFAADGYVYQWVCASIDAALEVWAEALRRMEPVALHKSPDTGGITGLETWVWYDGDPTVDPFQLAWTDPATGVTWTLEAWAWIATFAWDFGDDATVLASAAAFDDALVAAGSVDDPAGTHTYRSTSDEAGHEAGYPFGFDATWIGEWRWSSDGGASWSAVVPMVGTFTDTATVGYDVVQVRSLLVTPEA